MAKFAHAQAHVSDYVSLLINRHVCKQRVSHAYFFMFLIFVGLRYVRTCAYTQLHAHDARYIPTTHT